MKLKKILAFTLTFALLGSIIPAYAAQDTPTGASFEYISDIQFGYEGYDYPEKNSFYLYSPSNPHDFDLLSSFMNGLIFVYPDKPYASREEALADLTAIGLIDIAESCPAYIIVAEPANGVSWSEADVDMYYLYQYYAAGGYFDITRGIGTNPVDLDFKRLTMHSLQYVVAEGAGATFVNNYLSQHSGRIAGQVLFGGEMNDKMDMGYAVPSYLVGASDAAVSYWKAANETNSEPVSGTFVNKDYVQKQVVTAQGGAEFDKAAIITAWNDMLSRTTRLCITANLVLRSCEFGDWVLMSWPNYDELGITRLSYVFEDGKAEVYTEYESRKNAVHTLVPKKVTDNPSIPAPLVIVLHGMSDDPLNVVNGCGWAEKAAQEGFIVLSPDNEDAEYIAELIEHTKTLYNIDTTRIYITGFSMGGMNTTVSGYVNTGLFAAMAPMGATGVSMAEGGNAGKYAGKQNSSDDYDLPACVIVGSIDESNVKEIDGMKVMAGIEDGALEMVFDFNNIDHGALDYDKTPLWGYEPDDKSTLNDKGHDWVYHNFYKEGYDSPFIQLVTFDGAGHANSDHMATVAWDFLSQYSRASDETVVNGEIPFYDVSPSDWYYTAVNTAYQNEIINGRGGKIFDPLADVTRAEFATMLVRALKIDVSDAGEKDWNDRVSIPTYAMPAVSTLTEMGVIQGDDKGNFNPMEKITRQDMLTLLYRAMDKLGHFDDIDPNAQGIDYKDKEKIASYAVQAIETLTRAGLVRGSNGNISPLDNSTRSAAAQALVNVQSSLEK